jgi:hypothetical protein
MSTTTEAETVIAEQRAINRGWAVHRRAWQAVPSGQDDRVIYLTLSDLYEALDLYGSIRDEVTHPAAEWPDLEGETEAFAIALSRAAEDVTEWTDELLRVFPAAAPECGGN